MTNEEMIAECRARIAELEARRDFAAMLDDWFCVDVLDEDISVLTAELYDLGVAR